MPIFWAVCITSHWAGWSLTGGEAVGSRAGHSGPSLSFAERGTPAAINVPVEQANNHVE
jgi:hypothetical protein